MLIYLDWNVFDRLEKRNKLEKENDQILYSNLMSILLKDDIKVPYSNAHLRDLLRGYRKAPQYIDGHLNIISEITQNLCLCQYWNHKNTTLHIRSVHDFFNELKDEKGLEAERFEDLISFDTGGAWEAQKYLLKKKPVPKAFKTIYTQDPIFNILYPRTKKEMNVLALCDDLYNVSKIMYQDYSIYKNLKKFIVITRHKLKKDPQIFKTLNSVKKNTANYLKIDSIIDQIKIESTNKKGNPNYHKIFDIFFKEDIKGYKTDSRFPNMVDDGLHTFYGSHCDYFITNDDKCLYKAQKTFEKLKINTKVYTAKEFINAIKIKDINQ